LRKKKEKDTHPNEEHDGDGTANAAGDAGECSGTPYAAASAARYAWSYPKRAPKGSSASALSPVADEPVGGAAPEFVTSGEEAIDEPFVANDAERPTPDRSSGEGHRPCGLGAGLRPRVGSGAGE
jgi:hypothetical protein